MSLQTFFFFWSQVSNLGYFVCHNEYNSTFFYFNRGILSNFILDTSLQSSLPVFCLCDAEDGERTSILGIEKGKNDELTQYKITVAGPIPPTHANIQFDHLKSEMTFMTEVGEVREPKNDTISEIKSIFRSFRREHLLFTKPIVESISTMASQMEMKHSLDWNVLGLNQQKFLNFLTSHHRQKWWVTET